MPPHGKAAAPLEPPPSEDGSGERSSELRATSAWDEHRDVVASGIRLRVASGGSGPPVVLIHGSFVDHSTWNGVALALARDFRVVAPDLPGFGESEKPSPGRFAYDIESFAEAIADLYAGLDFGRAAVVGHALGGAVALTLAAHHPELVERLVLVAPLCQPANLDLRSRIGLWPVVGGFVFKQLWGRVSFRAFFRSTMLSAGARLPVERIDRYFELFSSPLARGAALATLRATVDTRAIAARTSRLTTPALVVWGSDDRLIPARTGQRFAREISGAGFELLDAGHAVQEERPGELASTIVRFLREERPARL